MPQTRSGLSPSTAHFVRRPATCVTGSLPSRVVGSGTLESPRQTASRSCTGNGVRPVTHLTVTPSARPTSVTTRRNPGDASRSPKTARLRLHHWRYGSSHRRAIRAKSVIVDDETSIRLSRRFLRARYRVSNAGMALRPGVSKRSVGGWYHGSRKTHSDGRELIFYAESTRLCQCS